jgi:hypothetical protein
VLDGCTAGECGIPEGVCNATAMQCYQSFSQCTGMKDQGTTNQLQFSSSSKYTGASEVGIDVKVSEDGLTVTWPKNMGKGVSGAAITSDGSTFSSGKWYFEARISGKCAMVGVANQDFRPHDRPGGASSWMWSDVGFGGVMFHESGKLFGPEITQGSTIGVAFDASTGQMWFARDGRWMTSGPMRFTSIPAEEASIASGYVQLRPVIGVSADCSSPVPVSISARFRAVDFEYEPPLGFTSMVHDVCACTEAMSLCLEDSNCLTHEMRETIYQQCVDTGCSKEQCGVTPGIQSLFCLKHESEQCAKEHHKCLEAAQGQGVKECACTKQLLECYQDYSCEMDDDFLSGVASLCMHVGCPAHECGICESRCNSTHARCHSEFLRCGDKAKSVKDHCACAASLYLCTEDCWTEDATNQHAGLCHELDCTAAECGLPDTYRNCNSTSARCHRNLLQCQDKVEATKFLGLDKCHVNYEAHKNVQQFGPDVCTVPWAGGIRECHYNKIADTCHFSLAIDCVCTKDYISCLREDGCEAAQETFEDICVHDRCSPEQCGLEIGPLFCERAEMQCNVAYANCESLRHSAGVVPSRANDCDASACMENGVADADCCGFFSETHCAQGFFKSEGGPGQEDCSANGEGKKYKTCCQPTFNYDLQREITCSGLCLRSYFDCMDSTGCSADFLKMQHRNTCIREGCSAEECGFSKSEDKLVAPDPPVSVSMRATADQRFRVQWEDSPQALAWARTGSRNHVTQYQLVLEGKCSTSASNTGVSCTQHLQTITISAKAHELTLPATSSALAVDRSGHTFNAHMHLQTSQNKTVLRTTEIYRLLIYSINAHSKGSNSAYAVRRLTTVPGRPPVPSLKQYGPYGLEINWAYPSDTGDGTARIVLTGYSLQIWNLNHTTWEPQLEHQERRSMVPNTFQFSQSTQSLKLQYSVGGTFEKCAEVGQTCYCQGIVRLGFGNEWSLPVWSQRYIPCSIGEDFPNTVPHARQICECNSVAIPLQLPHLAQIGYHPFALDAGRLVRACIAASNEFGDGAFSPCSDPFQIVGRPGRVQDFAVTSPNTRELRVTWSTPLDVGVGPGNRQGASILKYDLVLSTCKSFLQSGTCSVKILPHSSPNCDEGCSMLIPEVGNLVQSTSYYIHVVGTNELGRGFLWDYTRWIWKLRPSIEFPAAAAFPLRAVQWDGQASLWYGGFAQSSVELLVRDFPRVDISGCRPGLECKTKVSALITINSLSFTVPVYITSRENLTVGADFDDELGVDIITGLTFKPPAVGENVIGSATATLRVEGNTGLEASFQMRYFKYPLAAIEVFSPDQGFITGGTIIEIEIREPRGPETRHGARIVTLADASMFFLEVMFTNPNTGVAHKGQLERVQESKNGVTYITVRSPNVGTVKVTTPVTFLVYGAKMPTTSSVEFIYRSEYLASVVPASGLTMGGTEVKMIVLGVGMTSISGVTATISGAACLSLSSDTSVASQLSITCTTGPVTGADGTGLVIVSWREGETTMSVRSDRLFSYVILPDLEIVESSILVGVMSPSQAVVYVKSATKVSFTVKYLGKQDSMVAVSIGGAPGTSVTSRLFSSRDSRQSYSIIEFFTSPTLSAGKYPITVSTSSPFYGPRSDTSQTTIEFRDLASPAILDLHPSGGRMAGGSVLVASVISMCSGTCPPPSVAASLDGQPATVMNTVTLKAWLDTDSQAYKATIGSSSMASFFADISPTKMQQIASMVQQLDNTVKNNPGAQLTSDNVFLVFVQAPASQGSKTVKRDTQLSIVASSSKQASFKYTLFADPVGVANVVQSIPSSGSILGGTRVAVRIENFMIVHSPADLSIGGARASLDTTYVLSSTETSTELTFLVPPMTATGVRVISIAPVVLPSNFAEVSFTYSRARESEVLTVFPEEVYISGGESVTAKINFFGKAAMIASDVQAVMTRPGTDVEITMTGLTVAFDANTDTSTIVFNTYAMRKGLSTITMRILASNELARIYINYVETPVGKATMACSPSTGVKAGGTRVMCVLSNFRKVVRKDQLYLKYQFKDDLNSRIESFDSSVSFTTLVFLTPPIESTGEITIQVWAPEYSIERGESSFLVTKPLQAVLLYASPRSGLDTTSNRIEVGIGNLNLLVNDAKNLILSASSVYAAGVPTKDIGVVVENIGSSTLKATHVTIRLFPSTLTIDWGRLPAAKIEVLIRVSLAGDLSEVSGRFVEFIFTYRPADQPFVQSYSPITHPIDGRVPLYMRVVNTASDITLADGAYLDFGADAVQVAVTSIKYVSPGVADVLASVPQLQVGLFGDDTRLVNPRLVVPKKDLAVGFPEPFTYTAGKKPRIVEIFPKQGSVDSNTEVVIHVQDMPGMRGLPVSNARDIMVKFDGVQAQVLSSTQADPNKPQEEIQDLVLRVLAPCCSPQITAGFASMQVYNVHYGERVAFSGIQNMFQYMDPRKPFVSKVIGDDNAAFAKFSEASMVTLKLTNVIQPLHTVLLSQDSYGAPLQYEVKKVRYASESKTASVVVLFFGGVALGPVDIALYLNPISESSVVVDFQIEFYDEKLPRLTSVAPTEAAMVLETLVSVVIKNFPIVRSPSEIVVDVGGLGTSFGSRVSVESSTAEQTLLQFMLPAQKKASQQNIRIVPLGYLESRIVSFDFSFLSVSPSVVTTSRTSISSQAGDVLLVDIDFFHPVLSGPEVSVTLGALPLGDGAIKVQSSSVTKTQLELTFPASSATGVQKVTIIPRALGMKGATSFLIQVTNPNWIKIVPPVPNRACQRDGGAQYLLFLTNMPGSATSGDVAVRYQSQSFTVTSLRYNFDSKVTSVRFSTPVRLSACESACV